MEVYIHEKSHDLHHESSKKKSLVCSAGRRSFGGDDGGTDNSGGATTGVVLVVVVNLSILHRYLHSFKLTPIEFDGHFIHAVSGGVGVARVDAQRHVETE